MIWYDMTPIEHWDAALIILRESVDAMTSIADMLLFNTSTLSLIIGIVNHHNIDWEIHELD